MIDTQNTADTKKYYTSEVLREVLQSALSEDPLSPLARFAQSPLESRRDAIGAIESYARVPRAMSANDS